LVTRSEAIRRLIEIGLSADAIIGSRKGCQNFSTSASMYPRRIRSGFLERSRGLACVTERSLGVVLSRRIAASAIYDASSQDIGHIPELASVQEKLPMRSRWQAGRYVEKTDSIDRYRFTMLKTWMFS
jgi:hypothetical protein